MCAWNFGKLNANGVPSFSPGLARKRLPWVQAVDAPNPERVASRSAAAATLTGLGRLRRINPGQRLRRNPGLKDGTPLVFPGNP